MSAPRILTVAELQREGVILVEDGNHGEYRPRKDEFGVDGTSFIRAADMDAGRVLFDEAQKINSTALRRITKGVGAPGDILLSHKGTVGKVAFVPLDAPPFVCSPQTTFWRTLNVDVLDRSYLHAFLCSSAFHAQLAAFGGETDMAPYVSLTSQRAIKVQLPEIAVQRSIGRVLSTFDSKIELNRRMNETLETMAQTIFRDWFVDFGPVRRKLAGATSPIEIMGGVTTDPKRAAELAGLFPERLSDDELPESWCLSSIYDHASVIYGAPFSSERFNTVGRGRPLVRIRDLPNHGTALFTDEVHPKEYEIKSGDIVVGMDGEFRARLWMGAPSLMNQRVCTFTPEPSTSMSFVLLAIRPLLQLLEKTAIGTTVIHLGKKDIDGFSVVHPGAPLLKAFGEIADPMLSRGVAAGVESRSLAETRDYLLPRLMSGEVTVREAAQEVAA